METRTENQNPWLIAAWPGMGNVAVIAAGFLVHTLKMKRVSELPPGGHFELNDVEVKDGVIAPAKLPKGTFYSWKNPQAGKDLVVFLGEAQPSIGTHAYANELLEAATRLGVERVVTFASIARGMHPSESPSVFGVATDADTLADLRRAEVDPIVQGQIGGMNGVLLGAAVERGVPGLCLLAEVPQFAAGVPNPKAARAALSVFSVLAGIHVRLKRLDQHAAAVDKALIEAAERFELEREKAEQDEEPGPTEPSTEPDSFEEPTQAGAASTGPGRAGGPTLDVAARRRLEALFGEARRDAAKTQPLKQELDRLGVFKAYEDRFLDLFRRAA